MPGPRGPYRVADLLQGELLILPRTYHLVLGALALFMALLVMIPSWVLWKKSFAFLVGYSGAELGLAIVILLQAARRTFASIQGRDGKMTYLLVSVTWQIPTVILAIATSVLIVAATINMIIALAYCPSYTQEDLGVWLTQGTPNACSTADWSALGLVPNFATQFLLYQVCLQVGLLPLSSSS